MIDAKGFYDYDQRETGGISEEEFDEMNIGGYSVIQSPPPLEHPNSARSNARSTNATSDNRLSGSPSSEQSSPEKKLKMPPGGEEAIEEMVEKLWGKFDFERAGALDSQDCQKLVKDCLINLGSGEEFSQDVFD